MWQKLVAGTCVMTGAVGFGLALCGELSSEISHLIFYRTAMRRCKYRTAAYACMNDCRRIAVFSDLVDCNYPR